MFSSVFSVCGPTSSETSLPSTFAPTCCDSGCQFTFLSILRWRLRRGEKLESATNSSTIYNAIVDFSMIYRISLGQSFFLPN